MQCQEVHVHTYIDPVLRLRGNILVALVLWKCSHTVNERGCPKFKFCPLYTCIYVHCFLAVMADFIWLCVCVCVCVCGVTNFSTVVAGFIRPINTILQEQYSILCNTCKYSIMVCVCVFQLWLVSKSYKSLAIYIKAAVIRVW